MRVADRARSFGCDSSGDLRQAIRVFHSRWGQPVTDLRNALEHLDQGGAGIVPVKGGGTMLFVWSGGQMDVHDLFRAADDLCKAICRAIEPLET
jgi:hypothetical protein